MILMMNVFAFVQRAHHIGSDVDLVIACIRFTDVMASATAVTAAMNTTAVSWRLIDSRETVRHKPSLFGVNTETST